MWLSFSALEEQAQLDQEQAQLEQEQTQLEQDTAKYKLNSIALLSLGGMGVLVASSWVAEGMETLQASIVPWGSGP